MLLEPKDKLILALWERMTKGTMTDVAKQVNESPESLTFLANWLQDRGYIEGVTFAPVDQLPYDIAIFGNTVLTNKGMQYANRLIQQQRV